ncbi:hypothetical protein NPIL_608851 [Nephila pilipes]|uniref:Uncharacterized protein n=1 Tax=Nephila pilipes TaxID=299642 RepID=A0A8X6JG04_NEPPI|nr:hypothetical protein NPIL_608851 [Nephila pilipes]
MREPIIRIEPVPRKIFHPLYHPENLIFRFRKRKQLLMHVTTPFSIYQTDLRFDFWAGQIYQSVRMYQRDDFGEFSRDRFGAHSV